MSLIFWVFSVGFSILHGSTQTSGCAKILKTTIMENQMKRRAFIRSAAIIPAGLTLGKLPSFGKENAIQPVGSSGDMPVVEMGGQKISRLITGSNTINAGSHLSHLVNRSMQEYFTLDNTIDYFARCSEFGINTFQGSNSRNFEVWNSSKGPDESRNFISLIKERDSKSGITIEYARKNKFLGLAHHGEVTDRMFKTGQLHKIEDFLKRIRDAGILVGVSTHMPNVVDFVESRGWDIDFFMCCVYERHRSAEELKKKLGYVPLPVREVYLEEDPPRMYKMIQQTDKTCLAFKILAAGRVCDKQMLLEKAFSDAFSGIKTRDAVIVGMFPKWTDHIGINVGLVRKYGGKAQISFLPSEEQPD